MDTHQGADQQIKKLKAAKLESYWRDICENERNSINRNKEILKEFDKIEQQSIALDHKASRLKAAKKRYEEYINLVYPQWKEELDRLLSEAQNKSDKSKTGKLEDTRPHLLSSQTPLHPNYTNISRTTPVNGFHGDARLHNMNEVHSLESLKQNDQLNFENSRMPMGSSSRMPMNTSMPYPMRFWDNERSYSAPGWNNDLHDKRLHPFDTSPMYDGYRADHNHYPGYIPDVRKGPGWYQHYPYYPHPSEYRYPPSRSGPPFDWWGQHLEDRSREDFSQHKEQYSYGSQKEHESTSAHLKEKGRDAKNSKSDEETMALGSRQFYSSSHQEGPEQHDEKYTRKGAEPETEQYDRSLRGREYQQGKEYDAAVKRYKSADNEQNEIKVHQRKEQVLRMTENKKVIQDNDEDLSAGEIDINRVMTSTRIPKTENEINNNNNDNNVANQEKDFEDTLSFSAILNSKEGVSKRSSKCALDQEDGNMKGTDTDELRELIPSASEGFSSDDEDDEANKDFDELIDKLTDVMAAEGTQTMQDKKYTANEDVRVNREVSQSQVMENKMEALQENHIIDQATSSDQIMTAEEKRQSERDTVTVSSVSSETNVQAATEGDNEAVFLTSDIPLDEVSEKQKDAKQNESDVKETGGDATRDSVINTDVLLVLLSAVDADIEVSFSPETLYRSPQCSLAIKEEIIKTAESNESLDTFDPSTISMIVLEELPHILKCSPCEYLLSDELIEDPGVQDEKVIRSYIDSSLVKLWQALFKHWNKLLNNQIMSSRELGEMFGPLLISHSSSHVQDAALFLEKVLRSSSNDMIESRSVTPSLSLSSAQDSRKDAERLSVSSISHSSVISASVPNPGLEEHKEFSSHNSLSKPKTPDQSDTYEEDFEDDVPLTETAAYKNMVMSSGAVNDSEDDDIEEVLGDSSKSKDRVQDADEDIENELNRAISPDLAPRTVSPKNTVHREASPPPQKSPTPQEAAAKKGGKHKTRSLFGDTGSLGLSYDDAELNDSWGGDGRLSTSWKSSSISPVSTPSSTGGHGETQGYIPSVMEKNETSKGENRAKPVTESGKPKRPLDFLNHSDTESEVDLHLSTGGGGGEDDMDDFDFYD